MRGRGSNRRGVLGWEAFMGAGDTGDGTGGQNVIAGEPVMPLTNGDDLIEV